MTAATAAVRPTRREDLVEVVWRFFSSLGLVIPLIFALALASVVGTFINPAAAGLAEIQQTLGGRWWWRLYLAFELYDVFRSWWFTALLVLLALSIVACTIERLPRIAWVVLNPDRRLTDKVARGLRNVSRLKAGADADAESARVAAAFRARGFAPRVVKEGEAVYLFAQRAPWSRFGVWIVHLSLLVMLGGGIAGRLYGFEGTADVAPGGVLDSILVRTGSGEAYRRPLPFVARVNDFEVQFYESGTPKVFRSNVSLSDREGRPIPGKQNVDVTVNHPLSEQGLTIYQASYREDPTGSRARIAIADRTSGLRQPHLLARGEAVEVGGVR
ncbi:MAG TPA: cytochrome c biogenesis protein ResB, partial [Anaeromyxobacteraceae bacterium]